MLTDADLRDRSTGPTASTVAAMLNLNPYSTPLMAWLEVTGKQRPAMDEEALRMGNRIEPICRDEYAFRTGRTVGQPDRFWNCAVAGGVTIVVSATADGVTGDWSGGVIRVDTRIGLECKAHVLGAASDYGREGTDEVPAHEWVQCQVSMWCSGIRRWDLAVFVDNRVRIYSIAYDAERAESMVAQACAWWRTHVIGEVQPGPSGRELDHKAVAILWPGQWRDKSVLRPAAADESQALVELRVARLATKAAESTEAVIEQRLKLAIGDGDGLSSVHGNVTWRKARDGVKVDYEAALTDYHGRLSLALSAAGGDIIAAHDNLRPIVQDGPDLARFTTTTPGSRRFLVPRDWSK